MTTSIAGASTGINPVLLQASNEAAKAKAGLHTFIIGNDLKVLAAPDLVGDSYYPKAEVFPIPVPDFLLKRTLGLNATELMTALGALGFQALEGKRVEVKYDPFALNPNVPGGRGVTFVRVYTPNPPGTTNGSGEPTSDVEVPSKWLKISPKTPVAKAPVDTNAGGHKRPIAERVGEAAGKISNDPRMGQLNQIIGQAISLRTSDGQPTDVKTLMNQVKEAQAIATAKALAVKAKVERTQAIITQEAQDGRTQAVGSIRDHAAALRVRAGEAGVYPGRPGGADLPRLPGAAGVADARPGDGDGLPRDAGSGGAPGAGPQGLDYAQQITALEQCDLNTDAWVRLSHWVTGQASAFPKASQ